MDIDFDWKSPFLLEQRVAHIISQQAKHGTNFNQRRAKWFVHVLTERIVNIDKDLIPALPFMMHRAKKEYGAPFKMNGELKAFVAKYCDSVGLSHDLIAGPFTPVNYTQFDPGKVDKIKYVMIDMGWMPTEWNIKKTDFQVWSYRKRLEKTTYRKFIESLKDREERERFDLAVNSFIEKHFVNKTKNYMKAILIALGFSLVRGAPTFDQIKKKLLMSQFWPTSPKITDDSFDSLDDGDSNTLKLLKQRMVWAHRRSLIVGLIENIREDGKLSGEANPCATPTARMRHKIIVNIPAAGSPFGEECRSLFIGNNRPNAQPHLVKKLTTQMVESGLYRRIPQTNCFEVREEKKDGSYTDWEFGGHCSYLIPQGKDGFVGGDGAGLELRMLTHYLVAVSQMLLDEAKEQGNEKGIEYYGRALKSAIEYREVLLTGDIHSHNQRLAGLPTRKSAKTFNIMGVYKLL
ncbi:DNA polymerase [Aeromonas phage BUCT695]|uniref:DNA polymerase n=1 Tax=Aeromonas phage BUCT695 TaxID=2908630 RepID=UPI00232919F5|nr:DNA polymerase [Aeromonas phage BUCT695]UIW10548.1 DNA polymerase [Aeromonas phage BUCT695]